MAGIIQFQIPSLIHVAESGDIITKASSCGSKMVSNSFEFMLYLQFMNSDWDRVFLQNLSKILKKTILDDLGCVTYS